MIIKGNPAGSVKFWSQHLMRDDTNEKAEVKEINGLLAEDLPSALKEMEAIAAQSRCHGNFMYQANINPRDNERLTPEQWKEAVETLEKNLGLEGHQRVVIEHVKNGRQHCHIVWNRVDVETLRVADMGGNWPIHEKTSRELEERFGLTPTPSNTNTPDAKSAPELYEIRAAERSGIDPKAMKQELTELWRNTENGMAFAAGIEERGYILAKGDRRDFCVVDRAGDAHSLARRLDGVRAKDVREHMADIDRDALPSVEEARETQRERARASDRQEKEQHHRHDEEVPTPSPPEAAKAAPQAEAAEPSDNFRAIEFKQWRSVRYGWIETAPTAAQDNWLVKPAPEGTRRDPVPAAEIATRPALAVINAAGSIVDSLVDFVAGLGGGSPPKPEFSSAGSAQQLVAQRKALEAIENIRKSMERGEPLMASDVQNLTPAHLENIKHRGDDYMRLLIDDQQRDRLNEYVYGRRRER